MEAPTTRTCRSCGETKAFELFRVAKNCRFGRSYSCQKCHAKETNKYYHINKDKRKAITKIYRIESEKSKELKQPPLTKVCRKCGETKEFEVFKINKMAKFGRENTCNKCSSESCKKWIASDEYRREKYREKTRMYQRTYFNKNYSENKTKRREQNKKAQQNRIINLGKNYLKSILCKKLKLHFKDVSSEQVQLQKESILLHREFKQLKQQLQ
jgi:predicted NodU family carbamoyl transferase